MQAQRLQRAPRTGRFVLMGSEDREDLKDKTKVLIYPILKILKILLILSKKTVFPIPLIPLIPSKTLVSLPSTLRPQLPEILQTFLCRLNRRIPAALLLDQVILRPAFALRRVQEFLPGRIAFAKEH